MRNNLNILNQEGLYLFNPAPKKSIEEFLVEKYSKELKANHNSSEISQIYLGNNVKHFHCFDINKKLRNYIRKRIEMEGITKNYIYPDLNTMKKDYYKNFR